MCYWSPVENEIKDWKPVGGWNKQFSEQEKIKATHLFFFFKNKKGFKDLEAEMITHMVLFKDKYKNLMYSEDQERLLSNALKPIIH
jgi:hypothetical protein